MAALLSASAARVQKRSTHVHTGSDCAQTVPGSEERECASRMGVLEMCTANEVCKCPLHATLEGTGLSCAILKAAGKRKFDPKALQGKGCSCVTPQWVPTDKKVVHYNCPVESYFKTIRPELPDFGATALDWCNSKHVPADKLVPESLRGLYWMKNGNPHDIAFCTTRAEWNAETLTATMSPWTDFVWRKHDDEEIPATPKKLGDLVYYLKFRDASLEYADITTNLGVVNVIANLPLIEIQETKDVAGGVVVSEKKGDVFERPTSAFGIQIAKYYAVRIVDDAGKVHPDWYNQMTEAEHVVENTDPWFGDSVEIKTSFVRYEQACAAEKR